MHENTPAVKRWREKKKAEGKCHCGREKRPGKTKCQVCADNAIASDRKRKLGIDREQHAAMLESQGHACALCGCEVDKSSHIDHSHETGRVRGILCRACNTALGVYEKRIRPMLDKIEEYLQCPPAAQEPTPTQSADTTHTPT